MALLADYGIGTATAVRIQKEFEDKTEETVRLHPYKLTRVSGVGFTTADQIARAGGIPSDAPERIQAGVVHILGDLAQQKGHTCAPRAVLTDRAADLLGVEAALVQEAIDKLTATRRAFSETGAIIEDGGEPVEAVYLPWLCAAETNATLHLRRLLKVPSPLAGQIAVDALPRRIGGVQLSDQQYEAVKMALSQKVAVITGGPGTGKSTITRSILNVLRDHDIAPVLAAPTGRASKRMAEVCQYDAQTIHRLLGVSGPGQFTFDDENPLEGQFFIIDEFSMVDMALCNALVRALPDHAHLVIVGDADQLPSVGAGNVLADLISSGAIPVTRLDRIFRQAAGSTIISNAHRINAGKLPWFPQEDPDSDRQDFYFIGVEGDTPADIQEKAAGLICRVVAERAPQAFGVQSDQVQVLSPMRTRGAAGANALNKRLQAVLNPLHLNALELTSGERIFRVGDRILQTKNDYGRKVFNGETGRVVAIDPDGKQLTAIFDDVPEPIVYESGELGAIDLAYAMSIHKSQGSEYPVVVMPVVSSHAMMLTRNLFYTGITRAKQVVVLVGEKRAIQLAVAAYRTESRYSGLRWRLATQGVSR